MVNSSRNVAALAAAAAAALTTTTSSVSAMPHTIRDLSWDLPDSVSASELYGAPDNDYSCVPTNGHKNPLVLLHGLSGNRDISLNVFQHELNRRGYCTFSLTYGAHTIPSWIGGLKSIDEGSREIADFIQEVLDRTTAAAGGGSGQVDLLGYSEGGVQAIYTPLARREELGSGGSSSKIGQTISLGPALYGAEYYGLTEGWYIGGNTTRELVAEALKFFGCPACDDMAPDGDEYEFFQKTTPGLAAGSPKTTIIVSRTDDLVQPEKSVVEGQEGVTNVYVQDTCPDDTVGHVGLPYDQGVWRLVLNALEDSDEEVYPCVQGLPVRK